MRRVTIALIGLGLVIGLAAATAVVHERIVVVEPSRQVSDLETIIDRANFPLWVSGSGELWRVNEIGEGRHHTVFLDYQLDNGRRFTLIESFDPYDAHQWDTLDNLKVIERDVNINGYKAVLYLSRDYHNGREEWGGPILYWNASGTSLTLSPSFRSRFTREELIAIARSLRRVEQPGGAVSALKEIRARVTYPVFVPGKLPKGAKLIWVSGIEGDGMSHTTYLWYALPDARQFRISERASEPHQHRWETTEVIRRLEIHGQVAVLYVPNMDHNRDQGISTMLGLHWHEGQQTEITVVGQLTQEEIIGLAQSMREAGG